MRTWNGSKPENCDLCKCTITSTFVDGKTVFGPWGILCVRCHASHGVGLGTGKGQKFTLTDGQWVDDRDIGKSPKPAPLTLGAVLEFSDREIQKLLAERDGANFDHMPVSGPVSGEDDLEYIPGL